MGNKKVKSISFNVTNDEDAEMLKFLDSRKNISAYIKDLIKNDLLKRYAKKLEREVAPPLIKQTEIKQRQPSSAPKPFKSNLSAKNVSHSTNRSPNRNSRQK